MNYLALDLGSNTGWAVSSGHHITSGCKEFKADRFEGGGMRYLKFKKWLSDLHAQTGQLDLVAFEEVRRHAGTTAAHVYGGFLACLTSWCEQERVPYQGVPVAVIKKHVTGKGNAGKDLVISAVQNLGHPGVKNDNEADALAILHYTLDVVASEPKQDFKPELYNIVKPIRKRVRLL